MGPIGLIHGWLITLRTLGALQELIIGLLRGGPRGGSLIFPTR